MDKETYKPATTDMKLWQGYNKEERAEILQIVAKRLNLLPQVVEKDWWVVMTLKALSLTSVAHLLLFKGGTSLSKGWNLIERFSEDIDLAIKREDLFAISSVTKNQKEKLRKYARKYVTEILCKEVEASLAKIGIMDFQVIPITTRTTPGKPPVAIDSDKDPTELHIVYQTVLDSKISYISPRIKVEISCLSMHEPTIPREITSYISQHLPNVDADNHVTFNTVIPTRTFLEKAFLLNEEYAKVVPRTIRMSRHLYDLERLMDTDFGRDALLDRQLYDRIVAHRQQFYSLRYFDYGLHAPTKITIVPPSPLLARWEDDYQNMIRSFIYGKSLPFDKLITRITELQERFRRI